MSIAMEDTPMQQEKKEKSKGKRKQYSDEELTALGIFKDQKDSDNEQENHSSD